MTTTRRTAACAVLLVVLLSTTLVTPAFAAAGDDPRADQRIYLDPDTGEVLDSVPDDDGQPARATETKDQRRGAKAWTTDKGVQMLDPDPADAPVTHAVHCPDGSLRIGHAEAAASRSARAALCDPSSK